MDALGQFFWRQALFTHFQQAFGKVPGHTRKLFIAQLQQYPEKRVGLRALLPCLRIFRLPFGILKMRAFPVPLERDANRPTEGTEDFFAQVVFRPDFSWGKARAEADSPLREFIRL